jgi:hypothetical protein
VTIYKDKRGWAFPKPTSRKAHYFMDGKSLCGKYVLWATKPDHLEDEYHDHEDNCAACQRKRDALFGEEK